MDPIHPAGLRRVPQAELDEHPERLLSFLGRYARRWLRAFFDSREVLLEFLREEDVRVLAWEDAGGALCCAAVLEENAVLAAAFSASAEQEAAYSALLRGAEILARALGYAGVWFGAGPRSFGVYSGPEGENPFAAFLKRRGFRVEAVSYDVRHDAASVPAAEGPEGSVVRRLEADAAEPSDAVLREDLRRFPADLGWLALRGGELLGWALLDPESCVLDLVRSRVRSATEGRAVRALLIASIAADLRAQGGDDLIETNVDQLACQKFRHSFTICGRYESLVRG